MDIDIFLTQSLSELTDFFFLVYIDQDANSKRFKTQRHYLPKCIIKNYNIIINRKNWRWP